MMNQHESTNISGSTSTTPFPSLRPRTRRKISGLEDGEVFFSASEAGRDANANTSSSSFNSPSDSRSSSPNPNIVVNNNNSQYFSRKFNATANSFKSSFLQGPSASSPSSSSYNNQDPLASLSDLWGNSWTALQGLATSVVGASDTTTKSSTRERRNESQAKSTLRSRIAARSVPPADWGPLDAGAESRIGAGSREERDAIIRARKRQDLLTSGALASDNTAYPNAAGVYKRRLSDDRGSASAPPSESDDREALVYIHQVQPNDTLAGICIKYSCSAAVVRKANRMWPNDSVQMRTTIMIPVDASAVKGKLVPDPGSGTIGRRELRGSEEIKGSKNGDEILDEMTDIIIPSDTISPQKANGNLHLTTSNVNKASSHHATASSASSQLSNPTEPPWKHDSWVLLPHLLSPIQIGRLPRRTLGFFPPARRKSVTFSDRSGVTPRASFDLTSGSFHPSTPPKNHNPSSSSSLNTLEHNTPMSSLHLLPFLRDRSQSNTSTASSSAAAAASPPYSLRGPGGVGTLGKSVRMPGPAPDGLNKLFGSHLPNVAPPPDSQFVPWVTEDTSTDCSNSVTATGNGFDLENVGGAVEGWVRKMASHASKAATVLAESANTNGFGSNSSSSGIGINNNMKSIVSRHTARERSRNGFGSSGSGGKRSEDYGTSIRNGADSDDGRYANDTGDLIELTESMDIGGSGFGGTHAKHQDVPMGVVAGRVDHSDRPRGRGLVGERFRDASLANAMPKGGKGD